IIHSSGGDTKPYKGKSPSADQKKEKKPKGKKRKKWIILSIIFFVLLLSGIAALFIIPGILQPKTTTIPDVIEWEYEEAVAELEANNLKAEKEDTYSEDIEKGHVVKTDPRPDRTVKEGSTVTLFVSQGKEEVEFEDYIGKDFSQVKQMLEEQEYDNIISIEKFSDADEGEIITQIQ